MSELRDAVRDVISDRESGTAELCRNLKNGRLFLAEIEEIQETELNTELGRDAREAVLMHVLDRSEAACIFRGQKVDIQFYGQWATFEVLRRKDNPGDPQVEFGLMKLTEKDS